MAVRSLITCSLWPLHQNVILFCEAPIYFYLEGERKQKKLSLLKEAAVGQSEMLEDVWEDAFSGWRKYCKKKLWYGR